MNILVLFSAHHLGFLQHDIVEFCNNFLLTKYSISILKTNWLKPDCVVDFELSRSVTLTEFYEIRLFLSQTFPELQLDVCVVSTHSRRKKLLLADMDATIVQGETLDELADYAGLKEEISTITVRAMRGEIDFETALRQRVKMLKNLNISTLSQTLSKTILHAGAKELVSVMRRHGAACYLVSGGFTFFTEDIARQCGFTGHHGNQLQIEEAKLTGEVIPPILGKETKLELLKKYTHQFSLDITETMAVGDGANDIPMLKMAGLGVGFQPKPLVRQEIPNCIFYGDLTYLLYLQGYTCQDIQDVTSATL